jgi:SH3-like domain-containing protein
MRFGMMGETIVQQTAKNIFWSNILRLFAAFCLAVTLTAVPASAQDKGEAYWASIDQDEARSRTGPSRDYKIIWVYVRKNLPVKVLRRYGVWRQIEDPDGSQGWMHSRLLSRTRTAMIIGDDVQEMREKPDAASPLAWRAQPGVVGKLGACSDGWCRLDVNGRIGYVRAEALFGVGEPNAEEETAASP